MNITEIRKLIEWSQNNYHNLPWRQKRSPYHTLVSEIMLQQTTVPTVLKKFLSFIKVFPTIKKLANAQEEEVLQEWIGLGYYNRARNLHQTAQIILQEYQGRIPKDPFILQKLPGIGPYTAQAISSLAYDENYLALDGNLERVFSRYYGIEIIKGPKLKQAIEKKFETPAGTIHYGAFNEALMDLGREICKSQNPSCAKCFFQKTCLAYKQKRPTFFPVRSEKESLQESLKLLRLLVFKNDGQILLLGKRKEKKEWLHSQVEVPTFIIQSSDTKLKQYPFWPNQKIKLSSPITTFITKYRIENYCLLWSWEDFKQVVKDHQKYQFFPLFQEELWSSTTNKFLKKHTSFTKVSIVALRQGNKILFQRRAAHESFAGLWELPGGKVKLGETPKQAAIREYQEETGLQLSARQLSFIRRFEYIYQNRIVELNLFIGQWNKKIPQHMTWLDLNESKWQKETLPANMQIIHALKENHGEC